MENKLEQAINIVIDANSPQQTPSQRIMRLQAIPVTPTLDGLTIEQCLTVCYRYQAELCEAHLQDILDI